MSVGTRPNVCILLSHCLPIISRKQEQFSLISYQDMSSNTNLQAEPFLQFFSIEWLTDRTQAITKSCKLLSP